MKIKIIKFIKNRTRNQKRIARIILWASSIIVLVAFHWDLLI